MLEDIGSEEPKKQLGVVTHTSDPSRPEGGGRRREAQSHLQLHNEFKVSPALMGLSQKGGQKKETKSTQ